LLKLIEKRRNNNKEKKKKEKMMKPNILRWIRWYFWLNYSWIFPLGFPIGMINIKRSSFFCFSNFPSTW